MSFSEVTSSKYPSLSPLTALVFYDEFDDESDGVGGS